MNICVLLKQVPDQGSVLKIQSDETWVEEGNLVFILNESDSYALEEALRMKEKQGGEVVVCTLGPDRATQVLKDALAKGADRAIHIRSEDTMQLDSLSAAHILSAALKEEAFDLILCGLQSDDTGAAQVGPMLAEIMNLPHVTLVVETELLDKQIKVTQELEGGWYRHVEADLPALLAIQSGINKPRYASLKGIMAMKSKEIKTLSIDDLGLDDHSLARNLVLRRIFIPAKTKETQFLEGSPDEMVAALVQKLANEARVL